MADAARGGPLEGLKVVEMAGLGPCPLAGQMLADLGAEVLLIERAGTPAKDRAWDVNNRGKRPVALNLKTPEGAGAAMTLIKGADILIEGFRPGVMEKLGLGPEECLAANPGLVFGRMTGWGQDGPLSMTAGHDINYLSMTGLLWMMGEKGRPPVPPLNLVADYGGGTMFLLLGVLSALWERSRSGKGQVVDAAMVDGVSAFSGIFRGFAALGAWREERADNLLDGAAPFYRCYECACGGFLSVGPLEPQFFAQFVKLAGLPEAHREDQRDPATWEARAAQYAEVFRGKTRDEWVAIFEGTDACVAPVLSPSEAEAHPANTARGVHVTVGGVTQAAPAPRFGRTPAPAVTAARPAGSDTEAALAEAGLGAAEIAALKAAGALG
ncbi:CaiB/BaiF CoA transferase family protein [Rhodovulum sp. DZ06]|uniref:CaiB/BaiF CoA transferase family protein n=1 Tax=Rhodovulum sp. DZ06 TaxID=3425126 RepID=UPI003D3365A5